MRAGTAPDAIVDTSSDAIAEAAHHLVSSRRVVPGLTVEPDGKARSWSWPLLPTPGTGLWSPASSQTRHRRANALPPIDWPTRSDCVGCHHSIGLATRKFAPAAPD